MFSRRRMQGGPAPRCRRLQHHLQTCLWSVDNIHPGTKSTAWTPKESNTWPKPSKQSPTSHDSTYREGPGDRCHPRNCYPVTVEARQLEHHHPPTRKPRKGRKPSQIVLGPYSNFSESIPISTSSLKLYPHLCLYLHGLLYKQHCCILWVSRPLLSYKPLEIREGEQSRPNKP